MEKTVLAVGEGTACYLRNSQVSADAIMAETCADVRRLLAEFDNVELLLTDSVLPDGNWCDVLRLVVDNCSGAEVFVVSSKGAPILRFEVERRVARFVRALGSALSAADRESRRSDGGGPEAGSLRM